MYLSFCKILIIFERVGQNVHFLAEIATTVNHLNSVIIFDTDEGAINTKYTTIAEKQYLTYINQIRFFLIKLKKVICKFFF